MTHYDIPSVQLPTIVVHDGGDMIFQGLIELCGGKGCVDPWRELIAPNNQ